VDFSRLKLIQTLRRKCRWDEPPDPNSFETKAYPYPISVIVPTNTLVLGPRGLDNVDQVIIYVAPSVMIQKKGSLGNDCHRIALQVLAGEMKIIWGKKIIFKSAGRQLIYGSLQDSN